MKPQRKIRLSTLLTVLFSLVLLLNTAAMAENRTGYYSVEILPENSAAKRPTLTSAAHDASWYTENAVYSRLMGMKSSYPEGLPWSNSDSYGNVYHWYGGDWNDYNIRYTGYGCAAFALLMSDAAFGVDIPIWQNYNVSFSSVRVGDILRMNNDSHSVIILSVNTNSATIAEGNYNRSIHWGRTLSASEVESADYVLTRWPGVPTNHSSHTVVIDKGKPATCTETGLTEGKHCSVCGEVIVPQEVIPALGHKEVTDKAVEATCTQNGLSEGKHCSVCGEVIVPQEVIPALGHKEVTDKAVEATCTQNGMSEGKHCSVCGEIIVPQEVIPALGHKEVTDKAVEASCTQNGLSEGKHCSVCGEVIVPQEEIPALGHKEVTDKAVEATCTQNGLSEGKHCSVCGEILTPQKEIPAFGHTIVIDKAKPATETETGLTEGKHCSVCGEVLVAQRIIPKLGDNDIKNGLHLDEDGVWRYYINNQLEKFTGVLEYEGGQFFAADGILCSDANGLALFDGKWYFLAGGQVQTQYTGLALYDGEWFYITDGVLDTNMKGLIPYQGSMFLVADGQILRNVSGLWYDPFDTFEWYYLADGQVVTYYTGLAEYDGAMFYVIEGRLASKYTGPVDFNGSTYRVENGQVVSGVPMLAGAHEPDLPEEEPFDEPIYSEPVIDVADETTSFEEQPAVPEQPVESVPAVQPEEEAPSAQELPAEPNSESADEAEAENGFAAEEQPLVEISMSESNVEEEPVTGNDEAEEVPIEEPASDIILPAIEELLNEVTPAA